MSVTIGDALKYPFAKFGRLFYWLWVLIPALLLLISIVSSVIISLVYNITVAIPLIVIGVIAFSLFILGRIVFTGYIIRVNQQILKGKYKEVPAWGKFKDNLIMGLYMLLVSIVVSIVIIPISMIFSFLGLFGEILLFILSVYIALFVTPLMQIQLAETEKLGKALNIIRIHKIIFKNLEEYLLVTLQVILIGIILAIASIFVITVIITIPMMIYSTQYLYARFYADLKKKPKY